jgi:hypothetical protein
MRTSTDTEHPSGKEEGRQAGREKEDRTAGQAGLSLGPASALVSGAPAPPPPPSEFAEFVFVAAPPVLYLPDVVGSCCWGRAGSYGAREASARLLGDFF